MTDSYSELTNIVREKRWKDFIVACWKMIKSNSNSIFDYQPCFSSKILNQEFTADYYAIN